MFLVLHHRLASMSENGQMPAWEYIIVALPRFEAPMESSAEPSPATRALNDEGARGWEAVGLTVLADGSVVVLFKRPVGQAVDEPRVAQ